MNGDFLKTTRHRYRAVKDQLVKYSREDGEAVII